MLKYINLINQLSERDKLRMLCDISVLGEEPYKAIGIPAVQVGDIESYLAGDFPSSAALSNTWDKELVGRVAHVTVEKMKRDAINLAVVPSPKMKINPFRPVLSEDTLLATAMSKAYFQAMTEDSMAACLDDFRLTSRESAWMDQNPDERFVQEYIVKPYTDVASKGSCVAVLTDSSHIATEYEKINRDLTQMVANGQIAEGAIPISRKLPSEHTVLHFANGGLALEASSVLLEAALARYKQRKKEIEQGKATVEELQQEILAGKAISDEMIDEAVDRLLSLAFALKRNTPASEELNRDSLREQAVAESIVMLKNDVKTLPLKKNSRFCIIGDIAAAEYGLVESFGKALEESGHSGMGFARGYELGAERSDPLLAEAIELAQKSDVVFAFFGFGSERQKYLHKIEKLSLPANQLALLTMLSALRVKVVAILPSEFCPDVVVTSACEALLLAPLDTPCSATVLAGVLEGSINPSGRLSSTVYIGSDQLYVEHKTYRLRDRIRTGPFIGYRYYDTAGFYPGYPFGFGLSYTKFTYSQLDVSNDTVSFTVKNTGKALGTEVAQVYIGVLNSAFVRPRNELMDFARIELKPGEKKRISLPLNIPSAYDVRQKAWVKEKGLYTIGVGSSVRDICLTHTFKAGFDSVAPSEEALSDYIQSESNIIKDNYKLESRSDTMKKSVFNFAVGSCALLLAIVLKLFCISVQIDTLFFDVVAILIAIGGISLFIREAVLRNRAYHELKEGVEEKNEEAFENAEELPVFNAQQMFAEEFDRTDEGHVEQEVYSETIDADYLKYIDKEMDFMSCVHDFEVYATERGFRMDHNAVKNLFASLASSRLLLTEGMDDDSFHDLLFLLSGYFETEIYLDRVVESYTSADRVLFGNDFYGTRTRTNAYSAIEHARAEMKKIHFPALTNVHAAELSQYFTPYVQYVKNPLGHAHVKAINDKLVESTYYISPNVWFILNLASGETVDKIPEFISEVATVNHIRITRCHPAVQTGAFRNFTYYQMEYLIEKLSEKYEIDEDMWKRIDRLEAYVNQYTPYHVGNKLWLCLEQYALVHLACGSEETDAIDEAVAAKLLPSMIAELKDKLPKDEKDFAEAVESIFGEGHAEQCLRFIKNCGVTLN